jgi:hypothetical protein
MGNDFLLNRSLFDAIGVFAILKYVVVVALEIGVCLFVARQHPKLRKHMSIVALVFFIFGFLSQSQVLSYIWLVSAVVVTAIFANPTLNFGTDYPTLAPAIRTKLAYRSQIGWLALLALMITIWIGSSVVVGIFQGPHIAQKAVQFISQRRDGSVLLQFDDAAGNFIDVQLPESYVSLLENVKKADCLELTYFEPPLKPLNLGIFEDYVTQIRPSDGCK